MGKLRECSNVSDEDLMDIVDLPHLETLDISYCHRITDDALRHLPRCDHITGLQLAGLRKTKSLGEGAVLRLPTLTELDLTACAALEVRPGAVFSMTALRSLSLGS